MARTSAERQRDYRRRHARLVESLRAEVVQLRADLAASVDEVERLTAKPCRHPSAAVSDVGTCGECGADVW